MAGCSFFPLAFVLLAFALCKDVSESFSATNAVRAEWHGAEAALETQIAEMRAGMVGPWACAPRMHSHPRCPRSW